MSGTASAPAAAAGVSGGRRLGRLLPVGTPGGINSGLEGMPAGSGIVRRGNEFIGLDLSLYRLWRAAAAAPQAGDLISWGTARGIPDAGDRVRALTDAGLLVEDGPAAHHRIGRLALRLLGECLGNGADSSPAFLVLGRGGIQMQVDACLFEILLRSDGVSPVAATCDALDASRPGRRPGLEALIEGLPLLVRNQVVLLEGVR
ncbi:MAG: hypothetical protein ABSA53_28610 [Streptosporangiaceae bacterium]